MIDEPQADRPPNEAGARRHAPALVVLTIIAGAQFMIVLDTNIMNVLLPTMSRYFRETQTSMTWTISSYTLAFGGLLLLGGRVGDLIGRRQALSLGLIVFSAGGLLGGLAVTFPVLLVGRVIQGLGGALAAPAALSLLSTSFSEPAERRRAFAVYAAVYGAGAAACCSAACSHNSCRGAPCSWSTCPSEQP